jgi:hypothetical protein
MRKERESKGAKDEEQKWKEGARKKTVDHEKNQREQANQ